MFLLDFQGSGNGKNQGEGMENRQKIAKESQIRSKKDLSQISARFEGYFWKENGRKIGQDGVGRKINQKSLLDGSEIFHEGGQGIAFETNLVKYCFDIGGSSNSPPPFGLQNCSSRSLNGVPKVFPTHSWIQLSFIFLSKTTATRLKIQQTSFLPCTQLSTSFFYRFSMS